MAAWWTRLEEALERHEVREPKVEPARRSGVAAILAFRPAPEVLLMKRAESERDPWSGHVSLPGGRSEPGDRDLLHTAIRETLEEVTIDLSESGRLLGRLAPRQAVSRGRPHDMDVTPFVFRLEEEVEPVPREEAETLFWLPLDRAADGSLDGEHRFRRDEVVHRMPCWNFQSFVVWGMTHRILTNLVDLARRTD